MLYCISACYYYEVLIPLLWYKGCLFIRITVIQPHSAASVHWQWFVITLLGEKSKPTGFSYVDRSKMMLFSFPNLIKSHTKLEACLLLICVALGSRSMTFKFIRYTFKFYFSWILSNYNYSLFIWHLLRHYKYYSHQLFTLFLCTLLLLLQNIS